MFSRTTAFKLSYFLNTRSKMGNVLTVKNPTPIPRIGTTAAKISAISGLMIKTMIKDARNITGERMATRIIIMKEFWMLVMSVVMRVIRDGGEYLSMLANENFWTLVNTARRRFLANPADASAEVFPAMIPKSRARRARMIRITPSSATTA